MAEEESKEEEKNEEGSEEVSEAQENAEQEDLESEKEQEEVLEYNFIRSSRIPEGQRNTVSLIHSSYATEISLSLSSFLRAEVKVSLIKVEQQTFAEYINSLNNPTCIATFDMHPLSGMGLIEANSSIVFPVIDRMLGGKGEPQKEMRNFTELEIAISKKFISYLLNILSNSWAYILNITFSAQEVQTNPAFIRNIPQQELCLAITLNMTMNDEASGILTICIPYVNLDPISSKLDTQQWGQYSIKQTEKIKQAHHHNFTQMVFDVTAILGETELSFLELLALQKGDILDLGEKATKPIQVRVEGLEKFAATPGIWGKFKGVAITDEITKE